MGVPLAANTAANGHRLVVWNRDTAKARRFADPVTCTVAPEVASLAASSDVVISMVADAAVLTGIFAADDRVLAALAGSCLVDMSTSGPTFAMDFATRTRAHRSWRSTARSSVSTRGSEALMPAESGGIDRAVAYEAFLGSAAASPVMQYRSSINGEIWPEDVSFTIEMAEKDLRLITELARAHGLVLPQAEANHAAAYGAVAAGQGQADVTAIAGRTQRVAGR